MCYCDLQEPWVLFGQAVLGTKDPTLEQIPPWGRSLGVTGREPSDCQDLSRNSGVWQNACRDVLSSCTESQWRHTEVSFPPERLGTQGSGWYRGLTVPCLFLL